LGQNQGSFEGIKAAPKNGECVGNIGKPMPRKSSYKVDKLLRSSWKVDKPQIGEQLDHGPDEIKLFG
jgi:hypothetical protein